MRAEHTFNYFEELPHPQETPLTLIPDEKDPHGSFFENISILHSSSWETIFKEFEKPLSEQNVFGSNRLPTTEESRVVNIASAVRERNSLAMAESASMSFRRIYQEVNTFLLKPRTIGHIKKPTGEHVNFDELSDALFLALSEVNHPTIQVFRLIESYNMKRQDERLHNTQSTLKYLSTREINRLKHDLIKVTLPESIKKLCQTKIQSMKRG
ncbi:MAG: hypothetical protein NVSMB46_05530 [Candidatus Saccharimonadales bacterium]